MHIPTKVGNLCMHDRLKTTITILLRRVITFKRLYPKLLIRTINTHVLSTPMAATLAPLITGTCVRHFFSAHRGSHYTLSLLYDAIFENEKDRKIINTFSLRCIPYKGTRLGLVRVSYYIYLFNDCSMAVSSFIGAVAGILIPDSAKGTWVRIKL